MNVLAVVPARGGSKGVPGKNKRNLHGKPLVAWTIEAARDSDRVTDVVVSTDDKEIADIARTYGADYVHRSGPNIHRDNTVTRQVELVCLEWLADRHDYDPDWIIRLHPTSPLRTGAHIDGAIASWSKRGAVVAVTEAPKPPSLLYTMDARGRISPLGGSNRLQPRQDKPPVYAVNGAIYVAEADYWRTHYGPFGPDTEGYVMDARASVDIDTELDWQVAEMLMRDERERAA